MNAQFLVLKPQVPAEGDELVPCAIRLQVPSEVNRIASHFILLVDISESMLQDSKLENVKKCASLILQFLTPEDHLSVITFGDNVQVVLKRAAVDASAKEGIQATISALRTDGCTNLSAGLASVSEVMQGETMKTGLLILTDGHANRGVSTPQHLRSMTNTLKTNFENLSIHVVGQGTDHNADLLRTIAEDVQGSQNVVSTIEETAFAFADTLGGIMSCVAQNVVIEFPLNTVLHGSTKFGIKNGKAYGTLGDVQAGTTPLVLADIPADALRAGQAAKITGTKVPEMKPFEITQGSVHEEPDIVIRVMRLRYTCTSILSDIRKWELLNPATKAALEGRLNVFAADVQATDLDSNPIINDLRMEVSVLKEMLQVAQMGQMTREHHVVMNQHTSYFGLGRGFSTQSPSRPQRNYSAQAPLRRTGARAAMDPSSLRSYGSDPEPDDFPQPGSAPPPMPAAPPLGGVAAQSSAPPLTPTSSAFHNRIQRQIAEALTASVSAQMDEDSD